MRFVGLIRRTHYPGLAEAIAKSEQVGNGQFELTGDSIKGVERGRIPAAFDQAQKIQGHTKGLRELFLSHAPTGANLTQPLPETLP